VKKYVCETCRYIYDEKTGDPRRGVAPSTRWEDVPEDWDCPVCHAGKDRFQKQ